MRSLVLAFLACSALAQSPADDFPSHYLNGRRLLKEKDYAAASAEFHRALQIRADAPPALLGLIEAYALSGDTAHRDSETDHLRALIAAGKMPATTRFVREQFTAAEHTIVASEYPVVFTKIISIFGNDADYIAELKDSRGTRMRTTPGRKRNSASLAWASSGARNSTIARMWT